MYAYCCLIFLSLSTWAFAQDLHLGSGDATVHDTALAVDFKTVRPDGGNYTLICLVDGKELPVAKSGKPIFDIFNVTKDVIVVLNPVGFCTPAGVYRIGRKKGAVTILFQSSDNQSPSNRSVDYSYRGYDKSQDRITFRVTENLSYESDNRTPRVVAEMYVYLD